jgi:hypothetical protein
MSYFALTISGAAVAQPIQAGAIPGQGTRPYPTAGLPQLDARGPEWTHLPPAARPGGA